MIDKAPFFKRLYRGRSFTSTLEDDHEAPEHITSRIVPHEHDATGFEAVYATKGRYLLRVRQITPHTDFHDGSIGLGRLVIVFHLEGKRDTFINEIPALSMREPCIGIYYHPTDVPMRSHWYAGVTERAVLISSWLRDLPQGFLEALESLPQFKGLSSGPTDRVIASQVPLNSRLKKCVTEILELRMSRAFIPDYLEAKTLEALCLSIDQIIEALRSNEDVLSNNQAIVREAIERIESNIAKPDEIPLAARMAGMQVRDFSKVFQTITGMKYNEFVARVRIERAYTLICTTDLPLKSIAYRVGYSYTSNLSSALRKTYGRSPRDIRRGYSNSPSMSVNLEDLEA